MKTLKIELTDIEYKGLEYNVLSPEEWITNFSKESARIQNEKIVDLTIKHCMDNGIAVPTTRDDCVLWAFENNLVKTMAERDQEVKESMESQTA